MRNGGKHNILGVCIDAVGYAAAVQKIITAGRQSQAMAVSALAVHGVMTDVLDRTHQYRLNQLDLVVPDGQPVRWALNMLHGTALPDRVYGPTLMLQLCQQAAHERLPIYLYGSRPAVLEKLRANLQHQISDLIIAGAQPSRFRTITPTEKQAVVDQIHASGAALTFVGLGCPRQEVWVYEYRGSLSMPLIAVGAAFDFHAGMLSQAPLRLQQWGLEWLYRLIQEPRRLWKRYVFLNPLYLALVALQATGIKSFDPARAVAPSVEIGFG